MPGTSSVILSLVDDLDRHRIITSSLSSVPGQAATSKLVVRGLAWLHSAARAVTSSSKSRMSSRAKISDVPVAVRFVASRRGRPTLLRPRHWPRLLLSSRWQNRRLPQRSAGKWEPRRLLPPRLRKPLIRCPWARPKRLSLPRRKRHLRRRQRIPRLSHLPKILRCKRKPLVRAAYPRIKER